MRALDSFRYTHKMIAATVEASAVRPLVQRSGFRALSSSGFIVAFELFVVRVETGFLGRVDGGHCFVELVKEALEDCPKCPRHDKDVPVLTR